MKLFKQLSFVCFSGKLLLRISVVSVVILLTGINVRADELFSLRDAITAQERELKKLKARLIQLELSAGVKKEDIISRNQQGDDQSVKVIWGGPTPTLSHANERWSFKARGKFQTDFMTSHSDVDGVDYGSATEVRRVRLGAQGSIARSIDYVAEIDFNNRSVGFEDIYLRYRINDKSSIRLGYHEASVSLDDETSDSNHSFLERSIYNAMSLGRSVGVGYELQGDSWSLNTGVFGAPESTREAGQDEGWRAALRVITTPLNNEQQLWHVGVSGYYLAARDRSEFRVHSHPESHQLAELFDTGEHAINDVRFFAFETAYQHKNVLLQTEVGQQTVDYINLAESDFVSAYVQAAWVLTGEQRSYNRDRGTFGGLAPNKLVSSGGPGAIELALRYSHMDLVSGDIRGGDGDTVSLGVNWYPNQYSRMSANWVHFDIDNAFEAQPQEATQHQGDSIVLRSQLTW